MGVSGLVGGQGVRVGVLGFRNGKLIVVHAPDSIERSIVQGLKYLATLRVPRFLAKVGCLE